ncbi:hypothetical protein E2562_025368 [Oryza meyeriana var. granulata]|uniref:Uncharacterized protein n=1 Tax=Oryza meyeriana var. granulata TaxID=110450 RepID=A0A6G1DPE0_9ORYZ|nr:hypothetical protein E2562_025368 [Oryza meyeriana var. granulata]
MAGRGHGALWVKLYELELQLRLMRAARGEEVVVVEEEEEEGNDDDVVPVSRAGGEWWWSVAAEGTCRGRQYDAYMRRRDARRHTMGVGGVAAAATERREEEGQTTRQRGGARAAAAAGRPSPLALNCGDVKRSPGVSVPTTPRKESGALPRARTVNTGAAATSGGTARSSHQRRSSLGAVPSDFGDSVTPRPFLKRGSGTGGATTTPRLHAPPTARVHDFPPSDVAMASPRRPPPQRDQLAQVAARRRHSCFGSELPLHHHTAAAVLDSPRSTVELPSPQPLRARKKWGSPETPRAILSSSGTGDSHKDFAKGLKKLLSFVRKSSSSSKSGGDQQHSPARPAAGKPVISTGWPAAAAAPVTA